MDQQSRQQEQQQLQFYAAQESSFERPVEVEKSPLPVRRPTKALEIVDPKTNQAIQLAPASSTVAGMPVVFIYNSAVASCFFGGQ